MVEVMGEDFAEVQGHMRHDFMKFWVLRARDFYMVFNRKAWEMEMKGG